MKSLLKSISLFAGFVLIMATYSHANMPKIKAFLPDRYDLEESEAMPIDGLWRIDLIDKKIRIERGMAFAVDGWMHLFTLSVEPDMVIIKDITCISAGNYSAQELPLIGPAEFTLRDAKTISVKVKGAFGTVNYNLEKLRVNDEDAFAEELAQAGGDYTPPSPDDVKDSDMSDCELGIDPVTGEAGCVD